MKHFIVILIIIFAIAGLYYVSRPTSYEMKEKEKEAAIQQKIAELKKSKKIKTEAKREYNRIIKLWPEKLKLRAFSLITGEAKECSYAEFYDHYLNYKAKMLV